MQDDVGISEVRGFKELDRLLKKLPERVQKRVMQRATTGAMRVARKKIKAAAPKSDRQSLASQEYGRLSRNLRVKKLRKVKRTEVGARVDTGRAFWALFYELGTRNQPARPFMGPAFQESIPDVVGDLRKRLKEGIEKEASNLK